MITLEIQKTALKTLPESPGIYFVMEDQKCLYVGKSKNLFNRWNSIKHHRENQIKADHPTATLTYLSFDEKLLTHWEKHYIKLLKPLMNDSPVMVFGVVFSSTNKVINSLPISNDAANWLKVRSTLSDSSVRATVAKIIERDISRSKQKWIDDLEIASVERGLTPDELWILILNNEELPEPKNTGEAIKIQIRQRNEGRLYKKNSEDEK